MSESPDLDALSFKGRRGLARILDATGYSLAGLRAAYQGEAAFRQLVWLNLVLLPLAFVVDVSRAERALLVLVPLLALVVELLNSAIEAVVDRISLNLPTVQAGQGHGQRGADGRAADDRPDLGNHPALISAR
nr:diacylglycerol kinase [Pseudomonas composti]